MVLLLFVSQIVLSVWPCLHIKLLSLLAFTGSMPRWFWCAALHTLVTIFPPIVGGSDRRLQWLRVGWHVHVSLTCWERVLGAGEL